MSGGNLDARKARARRRALLFMASTMVSVLFLFLLGASIVNQSFGYVLIEYESDPAPLARDGVPLDRLDSGGLVAVLDEELSGRRLATLEAEKPLAERSREALLAIVLEEVVGRKVARTWTLAESILRSAAIRAYVASSAPDGALVFRSWVNPGLITGSQSGSALSSGLRGAAIGSIATMALTLLVAFPLGVGAAIWLEEYAKDNRLNRFIRLNIYNLAGVPSIIYGMLGLALFVRGLEPLTSGALFGAAGGETALGAGGATGRTILSGSLTLALLVLPVIIINAQEALRAVPQTLRHAGLALGATKWQTIRHHVLPASADRILTGTVLAMSRALGETAPLVVVGAATFLSQDPTGPFSRFTTLPIQIYQWTSRPQGEFKSLASAAILVLLALLLTLNATAIVMRNRIRERRRKGL